MESKKLHLEIIQQTINRLSQNSFLLKGWSVILVSAIFAISSIENSKLLSISALLPCVVFWFLDGYFLWYEKMFRKLYDKVRLADNSVIDFSMDVSDFKKKIEYFEAVFSITLSFFHGVILITVFFIGWRMNNA